MLLVGVRDRVFDGVPVLLRALVRDGDEVDVTVRVGVGDRVGEREAVDVPVTDRDVPT